MITSYYLTLGKSCNLNCIYCHQGQEKPDIKRRKEDVTEVDSKKVACYFPEKGDYKLVFYGGEPFLYFDKMLEIAYQMKVRNPHASLSLITNGTLLTVDKARQLNKLAVNVAVSHDGKYFEQTRKTKDFLAANPDPYLTLENRNICATASRINYNFYDIWDYFDEFCLKNGLSEKEKLYIQVVKDSGDLTDKELLIKDMPEWESMLDVVFANLYKNISVDNFDCHEWLQYAGAIRALKWRMENNIQMSYCGAELVTAHVDLDGNLYACHNLNEPNGHIKDEGMRAGNYNPYMHNKECMECPVFIMCGGGCIATTQEKHQYSCYTIFQQYIRILKLLTKLKREHVL